MIKNTKAMLILIIDNYDSFVFNLYQYIGEVCQWMNKKNIQLKVVRNDKITLEEIERLSPSAIIISPGPKRPQDAGISNQLILHFKGKVPILGVCLGHQCIGFSFGAQIKRANKIMHGKTSLIYHDKNTVYKDLPNPFEATRYHSLIVDKDTLPKELNVSAWCYDNGEPVIMGLRHTQYPIEGVQFHPESILTKVGKKFLFNFLDVYLRD